MRSVAIRIFFLSIGLSFVGTPETDKPAKPKILARVPEIFSVNPTGARRGTKVRLEILGENLDGAERLVVGGKGVEAKIVESSYLRALAELSVNADAPADIDSLRLISRLGVSNPLGFRVSELPEAREQEPNDDRANAQAVNWPAVLDAVLFPDEDTDFYRFRASRGERLKLEVLAARNGSGLNAEMYLLNNSGLRLAVGDDEERTDPIIEYTFSATADYYVVVRGVFSVLNMSFPTGHPAYTYQFRVTRVPAPQQPASSRTAEPEPDHIEIPGSVQGVIAEAGEVDRYSFHIVQPGAYVFEVEAGRSDSMLDSVLTLYDQKGAELAKNGDGPNPKGDSKLLYQFSEPGEYRIEIRQSVLDLHGPLYTYRVIARQAQPKFALTAVAGNDATPWVRSPDRLVAHRGMKITIPVSVEWLESLEKSETDIQLKVEGLPPGVTASDCQARVKDGQQNKQSRFTARVEIPLAIAQDTPAGTYAFRIKGHAKLGDTVLESGEKVAVSAAGRYVMAASGGFPQTLDQRYLSIVEPVPFALRPEIGDERYPIRFTMQPGTNKTLVLSVLPPEKFTADVEFSTEGLPRGLNLQHVESRAEAGQYILHLQAAPDCERGWFPIVTFIARHAGTAIPAPYFGMSVQ